MIKFDILYVSYCLLIWLESFDVELSFAYDYYTVYSKKVNHLFYCRKNKFTGRTQMRTVKPLGYNEWIAFRGNLDDNITN